MAQSYSIFCQFRSTLVITHTIAIKWKEKYHAVVVNYHHSLRLCGDKMKKSLSNFLGEIPTSPWVPFRGTFRPIGRQFCPSCPLAYSLMISLKIITSEEIIWEPK